MGSDFSLKITIGEGKVIFKSLSELPFKEVFELIGKLNQQTISQKVYHDSEEIIFTLTKTELEIIKKALSGQPFYQVSGIMEKVTK
jgi:hypothetical protein